MAYQNIIMANLSTTFMIAKLRKNTSVFSGYTNRIFIMGKRNFEKISIKHKLKKLESPLFDCKKTTYIC